MSASQLYSVQLNAGLGLVPETGRLLELWEPGMTGGDLLKAALASGSFASVSARRLRNIVIEAFGPRYLVDDARPAKTLKSLQGRIATADFRLLLLIYTCRANAILGDFIRDVYWVRYAAGSDVVLKEDAQAFVGRAVADGKTRVRWTDTTIIRVSRYVLGACADFGLLGTMRGGGRIILPFRITPTVSSFLAHDLHFRGQGDNAIVQHPDWALFGLEPKDVVEELKRLSLRGQFILQSAGNVTHIAWGLKNWGELPDALAAG